MEGRTVCICMKSFFSARNFLVTLCLTLNRLMNEVSLRNFWDSQKSFDYVTSHLYAFADDNGYEKLFFIDRQLIQ
jgi:hypothetical protein